MYWSTNSQVLPACCKAPRLQHADGRSAGFMIHLCATYATRLFNASNGAVQRCRQAELALFKLPQI